MLSDQLHADCSVGDERGADEQADAHVSVLRVTWSAVGLVRIEEAQPVQRGDGERVLGPDQCRYDRRDDRLYGESDLGRETFECGLGRESGE